MSAPSAQAPPAVDDERGQTGPTGTPPPDEVDRMISEAAYYLAQERGFEPGHEIDDWLQAEAQVYDLIAGRAR